LNIEKTAKTLKEDLERLRLAIIDDNAERKRLGRPQDLPRRQVALRKEWGDERYGIVGAEYDERRVLACERNSIEYQNDPQR
jgi:hypothetical protein